MLCKKVQFETSWLISIYFTYHQSSLFLQRSPANAARYQPELQQDVSSTHSLISSAGPHMWLDGEHLPGRIDVNDSVKKMELELKQISHLQFLQFICAPWSGQPNPLRRMLCQPKPLRTAYLRQPNEDQDKHALVRLAQISDLQNMGRGCTINTIWLNISKCRRNLSLSTSFTCHIEITKEGIEASWFFHVLTF